MFKPVKSEDGKCGYAVPVTIYVNAKNRAEAKRMMEKAVSLWPSRVHDISQIIQMTKPGEMFGREQE